MSHSATPLPSTQKTINELPQTPVDLHELIRHRAYELYESRNRKDGFADQDWFQAESELCSGLQTTNAA